LFRDNSEDYRRAVQAYRKAVELDPAYAPAWAGLALATYFVAWSAESAAAIAAGLEQARAAADKAVALRPDLVDGYMARGLIRASVQWDYEGADEDLRLALALGPENAHVLLTYAFAVLMPTGRLEEGVATLRKAIEIDPLNAAIWGALGGALVRLGKFGPAREALSRTLEINPENSFAPGDFALAFLLEGRPAEALAISQRSSQEVFRLYGAALAHHDLGHAKESQRLLDELIAKHAHSAAYQVAGVYAWRGEKDRAFQWLERARAQRDGGLSFLKVDPVMRGLRGDPRWGSLLKAVNLPAD
jgi:tetratricopeptide (TPR) repeat protein